MGDVVFIGLVSLEFAFEPARLVQFLFTLLDLRTGILVGESLHFLAMPLFPQCVVESWSQSLFGVPTMGDSVVGLEIRLIGRDRVNTVGVIPKSIIDPPNSLRGLRRGETELSRRILKRSVLLEIRLFRRDVDMLLLLLTLDIFGVETLLLRRGIFDGRILPPPATTPNKPL